MAGKKDNSAIQKKVALRRLALRELIKPSVVETNGGTGRIYLACYGLSCPNGVVFETDPRKAEFLAEQRPAWAVYESDCVDALAAGVGFQYEPNLFDVDPYGESWRTIDAIFGGMTKRPDRIVFAVNDALKQKLATKSGWHVGSMRGVVEKYGNDCLFKNYLEICKELMTEKAADGGYRVSGWTGYYCGDKNNITHFAAVLDKA